MIHSTDEQILARLSQWLEQTRLEADHAVESDQESSDASSERQAIGLYRLVEEFTAMRHELKLQTRSARGLEEDIEKLLGGLRQAIDAFQSVKSRENEAAWSAGKAMANALAELDEALSRGKEQLDKAAATLLDDENHSFAAAAERIYQTQSWWGRWKSRDYHRRLQEWLTQNSNPSRSSVLLQALLDGYGIIRQRLARAMADEGISRIPTVGERVDPERMLVVEVVQKDGPPGIVVDEVRPGYLWNNRLLRCAEVRATRL